MSDLISRVDAIEAIASRDETDGTVKVFTGREVNEILSALPSAEPKTGEWVKVIDEETPNVTKWHYECDQCRTGRYENGQRYCHNCGARMKGGEEK